MNIYATNSLPKDVVKLCKDCIYFNPKIGTCKKFIKQSLINGDTRDSNGHLMHPQASTVRSTSDYCGYGAKYFQNLESYKKNEQLLIE